MACHSLTQSKVLSPANRTNSSSFNVLEIHNPSILSNDSFAKQTLTTTQEDSTPYLQYIATEQTNGHNTGFNLQSKILSVLKKYDRTYNESVLVYKHLKHSNFYQKFRQDNPNLRLTDALINLSKILEYHVFSPGAIIHRKGDPSNKRVYLVFSGKIDLYDSIEKKAGFETPRPPAPKLENKAKSTFSLLGVNREDSNKTPKANGRSSKPGTSQGVTTEIVQDLGACKTISEVKSFKFETLNDEDNEKTANKAWKRSKVLKKMKTTSFALKHAKTTVDIDKALGSSRKNEDVQQESSYRQVTSIDNLDTVAMKLEQIKERKGEASSITMDVDEPIAVEKKVSEGAAPSILQKGSSWAVSRNKFKKNFLKASFKGIPDDDLPKSTQREELVESYTSIENYMNTDREMKIKKGSVYKGEIFGDESLEKIGYVGFEGFDYKRRYTAQVGGDKECVLLSFCREDYEYLCTRYDPENTRVLDFLLDYVPDLDKTAKEENLRRLESHWIEETYNWHQQVTVQGQRGNKIYLLFDGLCEVLKEVRSSGIGDISVSGGTTNDLIRATSVQGLTRDYAYGNKMMSILICVVKSGVFIGEEILFNGTGEYEYTVKAGSTKVRLLELDKETFFKIIPEKVQKSLRNLYNQKTRHNQEILNSKLQLQADIKQQRAGTAGNSGFESFDDMSSKETKEKKLHQSQRVRPGSHTMQSRVIKSLVTITSKLMESPAHKQQLYGLTEVKKGSEISLRKYLESEVILKGNKSSEIKELQMKNNMEEIGGKKRPRVLLRKKKGSILRSDNNIIGGSSEFEEKRILHSRSPNNSINIKPFLSPKAGVPDRLRFDFGRDLSESLVVKEVEVERDQEARMVLKMKKRMMDRERYANNTSRPSTCSFRNSSFGLNTTPKNNKTEATTYFETNCSVWQSSPKNIIATPKGKSVSQTPNPNKVGGTPTSKSGFFVSRDSVETVMSSPRNSMKPKLIKRFSFNKREISPKVFIEKTGRAFSMNVIQKPLKDENRDEYPMFELYGKGVV